ncbi:MAG TPA: DUF4105 domain-containing protein [Candidatus Paceibacterota bacterium]|nr:DUF4105 domain-containing protein [Candidatus Paceibacterota bacterium]
MKKTFKILIKIILAIIVFIIFVVIVNNLKTPSNDREWSEESAILPSITINDSIIEVKNIRDWRYEKGSTLSKNYYDDTFDIDKIEKTWLLFNPFGKWEGVGHFFFVFEFEDGQDVSVSIEARREKDEDYKSWKGVFNKYELWYAFGSSADFMTRRVMLYDEDLYIYPLLISKESSKALFVDIVKTAKNLETEPQFYNTITSNCTNLLADAGNRVKQGSIPFHYSRLFTGFADNQLYDLGLIPNDAPFEEVYLRSRIDEDIREIFLNETDYSAREFWEKVKLRI